MYSKHILTTRLARKHIIHYMSSLFISVLATQTYLSFEEENSKPDDIRNICLTSQYFIHFNIKHVNVFKVT